MKIIGKVVILLCPYTFAAGVTTGAPGIYTGKAEKEIGEYLNDIYIKEKLAITSVK